MKPMDNNLKTGLEKMISGLNEIKAGLDAQLKSVSGNLGSITENIKGKSHEEILEMCNKINSADLPKASSDLQQQLDKLKSLMPNV